MQQNFESQEINRDIIAYSKHRKHTNAKRIDLSKCLFKSEIKFVVEVTEKIAQIVDKCKAYYSLLLIVIQYQSYAYEHDGYLIELVLVLTTDYRVANRPLNPLALEHVH